MKTFIIVQIITAEEFGVWCMENSMSENTILI